MLHLENFFEKSFALLLTTPIFLIFLTFFFTNFCLFDIIVFTCERRGVAQFGSAHEWGS